MGLFDFLKKKPTTIPEKVEPQKRIEFSSKPTTQTDEEGIPTLASRIKNAFPSSNGLYPHEILMLDYASSYKTSGNSFQNFWKWNYSVLDPQRILDSLFERGFICRGDAASALKRCVVADLKAMLSQKGAKATGKKEELISRILETYSTQELEQTLPDRHYALTELGEQELKENEYVSYLHRHRYMSVWEMNIMLHINNPSHLRYRDIIWRELNKQSGEHFQNYDFGLYRNTRLSMHNFLFEEKKYKTALHLLCEVISFDLSGLGNGDKPISNNDVLRQVKFESRMVNLLTTEDKKEVTVPPGIIGYFERLYKEIGMTSDEFVQYTYEQFAEIYIHDRVFTESECANIILSEIGLEERKMSNSRKIAEQRVKKKLGL